MRNSKLNKFFRNFTIAGGIIGLMAGLAFSALSFTISAQTGIIITAAFIIFCAVFYLTIYRPAFYKERILAQGEQAEAKITGEKKTGIQVRITGKTGLPLYKLTVEIRRESGETYTTAFMESVTSELMKAYHNNIKLTVRFNPEKKEKIIVEKIGGKIFNDKYTLWSQKL